MTRKMLRLVILLAAVSLTGILATQIFWLRKAFDLHEKQFTLNVNVALKNVVESLCNYSGNDYPGENPVEQLGSNYFIVRVNHMIEPKVLEYFLKAELRKSAIASGFEYGIYDCSDERMVYGGFVRLQAHVAAPAEHQTFPKLSENDYYFGVLFPERPVDLAGQMGIWTFSSLVLIIVVIFFAFTLFVIFRQKRLSEIQKDFINNMTHEFKTPISTIALSTEVLKDPNIIQNPSRLTNYATIIETENTRLKNQVERVLQMAHLDTEEIQLKRSAVDLHSLIEEAVDRIKVQLTKESGTIDMSLEASNTVLNLDRLHVTNILFNLLDNAIKYCDRKPSIAVSTTDETDLIKLTVRDNGIGISKEEQSKVFDRFYRVSTGNRHDVKGFGIGLNYVRLIVKAHGGKIKLGSQEGLGSVFSIWFPKK